MSVTYFSNVYPYGLNEIDDIRLDDLKSENPALYLRRLWDYLKNAIPRFSSPKGIQAKMSDYVEPIFSDSEYVGDGIETVFSVQANADYICVSTEEATLAVIFADDILTVNGITYSPENGTITFDNAPYQGMAFYIDCYTDGYFNSELNQYELDILGIAFRLVWFSKIANTFLRTTPKIKDKNFNMDSSWGMEQADTAKTKALRVELVDAMTNYENYLAYHTAVPVASQLLHHPSIN